MFSLTCGTCLIIKQKVILPYQNNKKEERKKFFFLLLIQHILETDVCLLKDIYFKAILSNSKNLSPACGSWPGMGRWAI